MRNRAVRTLLLLAVPLTLAAQSAPPSLEERLSALEQKVQALSRENAELKDRLGLMRDAPAPVVVKPAGKETSLSIGGFLHGQAEFGRAPDPRFASGGAGVRDRLYFRRARINVAGAFGADLASRSRSTCRATRSGPRAAT